MNTQKLYWDIEGEETFAYHNYISGLEGVSLKSNLQTYINSWKEAGGYPLYDAKEDLWIVYNKEQAQSLGLA